MRIFAAVLTVVFYSWSAIAQTGVLKGNNPSKIKNYNLPSASDYNTWDLSGHMGFAYPYTDISSSGTGDFAFGIDVTKFLSHTIALQTRFIHATLSGIDINKPDYRFNTTIDYDLTLNAIVQVGNISFLKKIPDLAFYGSIGIGLIHYSPEVYIDGGHEKLTGVYSQYTQPLVEMDYQGTTDLMIPFGIGAKYRISKNHSVSAEYSFRKTNSDKLDGFYKLLSDNDNYSYFSFGFTFHLGSKTKTLEWENPIQEVYNELYDMKEKLDLLNKDTDKDGVADLYDREPGTQQGSKVYGDGTSVDTDGDGVPDINDAELFSEKNAKVDLSGKTIFPTGKISEGSALIPVEKDFSGSTKVIPQTNTQEKNPAMPPPPEITKPQNEKVQNSSSDELPSIFFDEGEETITSKHYKSLDYVGHKMQENSELNYMLIGVCDAVGSVEYNIYLGKRRAEAVKYYLIDKFKLKPNRLFIEPVGIVDGVQGSNPFNRRVDIKIKK